MSGALRPARLAVALACAAGVLSAVPSHAGPFVGKIRVGSAQIRIAGSDGRIYQISAELVQSAPDSGAPSYALTVAMKSCNAFGDCQQESRYAVPTSAATVAEDISAASVKASFGGVPLDLRWSASPADPTSPNLDLSTHVDNGVRAREQGGGEASFQATLFGVRCLGIGALESYRALYAEYSSSPTGARPPMSAPKGLRKQGKRAPKCMKPSS